jgi:uncharacterized protein with von Willebrand factor type A (vWA) domain
VVRTRYTAWDGSQRVRLDADELFDRFAEYMSQTDDAGEALDALLRDGYQGDGFEVIGIDELMARVERAIEELLGTYNLDHALDEPRRKIDELLEQEQIAAEQAGDSARLERLQELFDQLRRNPSDALRSLEDHDFLDEDSEQDLDNLHTREDDIAAVSEFVRRNGGRFHGPKDVDLDGALDLIQQLATLENLLQSLMARDFDAIDPDEVGGMMGAAFQEAIDLLREMMATLVSAGYVTPKAGRVSLSPKGARKLGQLALREIHKQLGFDAGGRHETTRRGPMEVSMADSRPYHFGDPLNLNVAATVRNAVLRGAGAGRVGSRGAQLAPEDFEVYESTYTTRSSTVLLLDMSWSMSWEGRFAAAKKVALAMETLMRTRYPRDYFGVVGFYTRAVELQPRDLPVVTWNMGDPFTNLQDGLRVGGELLARQPGRNKNMIVITDGQPTAYFAGGKLFCEWPTSMGGLSTRATVETLEEVKRVTRQGVKINTFMLDDSPPLRSFVEKMTNINKGRAFYTTPNQLGRFLMVDYVGRRRKII